MTRRGLITAATALVLLVSAMPVGHAREASFKEQRCRRALVTTVNTFHVEVDWHKKVYKPNSTVKVTAKVTRPGEEDPLNNGVPMPAPERMAAEGVNVTAALFINPPYYPYASDVTNSEGIAELRIKLPKGFKGPVDTHVRAWYLHNANGPACSEVLEEKIVNQARTFTVR